MNGFQYRRRRVWQQGSSTIALLVLIVAGACAGRHATIRQEGRIAGDRWKNLVYFGGSIAPSPLADTCDLVFQGDRIVIGAPSTHWKACPIEGTEIPADAVTWVGYARGRFDAPGVAAPDMGSAVLLGVVSAIRSAGAATHFVAIGYRDGSGADISVTFFFPGRSADALLRLLVGVGRTPILAAARDIAALPQDLRLSAASDPLKVLVPGVPLWDSRQIPLSGSTSGFQLSADGSVALTDEGVWSIPDGTLVGRVRRAGNSVAAMSADGRTVVVRHNSGAINDKTASRAGELTVFDARGGTPRGRARELPYLDRVVIGADGAIAFAFHEVDPGVSAVALDKPHVVWRSSLPAERGARFAADVRGAHGWSDGLVAFGRAWVGVWRGATGERLFEPAPVLQDISADEQPVVILDAHVIDPASRLRLLVVYGSRTGSGIAHVEIPSGRIVRTARLRTAVRDGLQSGRHWLSNDRTKLLIWTREGPALWETATLTYLGTLAGQRNISGAMTADFDGSSRRVATAVQYPPLDRIHVVVWDVGTREAIGQCLLDAAGTVRFAPDGHAVLAAGKNAIAICEVTEHPNS